MILDDHYTTLGSRTPIISIEQGKVALSHTSNLDFYFRRRSGCRLVKEGPMRGKKVWFITGAGRGLGVDIAKAALAAGNAVVPTGRNTDEKLWIDEATAAPSRQ